MGSECGKRGAERWPELPDVPAMQEAGIPNAVVETWQMLLGPATMAAPEFKEYLQRELQEWDAAVHSTN